METRPFSQDGILFGREPDARYLYGRAFYRGVTVVVGRSMMGKTSLLTAVADRLSRETALSPSSATIFPALSEQQTYHVGWAESSGEVADLLLRAVSDLYARWLADSRYIEQAKAVWLQQSKDVVGRAGQAVGTIFEKISKLPNVSLAAVGVVVKEGLEALVSANRDLVTGRIQLPQLQIDQARELLELVYKITGRSQILVFDQWEKSPSLKLEANILDSFLRHAKDWPPCHIFISSQPLGDIAVFKALHERWPIEVVIYPLPPMHLEEPLERAALLQHIRSTVPAAAEATDDDLLELIDGYPAVVDRWTRPLRAQALRTLRDMKSVAEEVNTYRFGELDTLADLGDEERRLSIRLALLPLDSKVLGRDSIQEIVLEGSRPQQVDSLFRKGILERFSPPTYGHSKRGEAALRSLISSCPLETREIFDLLASRIAGEITELTPEARPFLDALVRLRPTVLALNLGSMSRAFCDSALALFGECDFDLKTLIKVAVQLTKPPSLGVPLISTGLFNAIIFSKEETDSEWGPVLLDRLRALYKARPDSALALTQFSNGLYNLLNRSLDLGNVEEGMSLLDELRNLAEAHPDFSSVHTSLTAGLFNAFNDAAQGVNLATLDSLLGELRTAVNRRVGEAESAAWLACALMIRLHYRLPKSAEERGILIGELTDISRRFPKDEAVRGHLAHGLQNAMVDATQQTSREECDLFLSKLRQIAYNHPEDPESRKWFAGSIYILVGDAKMKGLSNRLDLLEQELRQLARNFPADEEVCNALSHTLLIRNM